MSDAPRPLMFVVRDLVRLQRAGSGGHYTDVRDELLVELLRAYDREIVPLFADEEGDMPEPMPDPGYLGSQDVDLDELHEAEELPEALGQYYVEEDYERGRFDVMDGPERLVRRWRTKADADAHAERLNAGEEEP